MVDPRNVPKKMGCFLPNEGGLKINYLKNLLVFIKWSITPVLAPAQIGIESILGKDFGALAVLHICMCTRMEPLLNG